MDITPYVTHLAVFVMGILTWLPFTIWEGHRIHQQGECEVPSTSKSKRLGVSRMQFFVGVILVSSLFVIGLGVQQVYYQREANANDREALDRDQCYEDWGRDVIDTLRIRVSANKDEALAQKAKDRATDEVLLTALSLIRAVPPVPPAQANLKFGEALDNFAAAREDLIAARAKAKATTENNPYPQLDCSGQKEK